MAEVKEETMEGNEIKSAINGITQPIILLDLNFQKKLIKTIIEDEQGEFSTQVLEMLKPDYFETIYIKDLVKYIINYLGKYNMVPGYETLRDIINEKEKNEIVRENLLSLIDFMKDMKIADKQNVKDITLNFCKKQSLKKGLLDAVDNWERGDYENIAQIISEALKVGEPKNTGHNYVNDIEKRLIRKHRAPISVLQGLDYIIGGGLAGGELGVILSPTGGGKSMMLVKFACTAFDLGKNVLYYSLELSENNIGNRIDSCLTGIKLSDILEYPDHIRDRIAGIKEKGGKLIIKEFPTGSASVNTIKNHLKVLQREGFIPDVIFIDYADIMKPIQNYNERRFSLTSIYESIRGMAMEMNIPIWTASQAGRAAFDKEKFGLETISESIGKAQTADVIFSVARSNTNKTDKVANLTVAKNRNGVDGKDITLHFDTTNIDIHVIGEDKTSNIGMHGLSIEDSFRKGTTK